MAELLAQIIRNIVDAPEEVAVNVLRNERGVVLQVKCAADDVGKVIGREGRIINALRTIVRSSPRRGRNERVTVELAA
jgi:uncharacterized protein